MKIPLSVRDLYQVLLPHYLTLKQQVDARFQHSKEGRWHYESRIKSEESFALKLETGRVANPSAPEDFFACCIVVENQARVSDAESLICKLFSLIERKPPDKAVTPLPPHSFDFDDLRMYVKWIDDPQLPASGIEGIMFEIQVKTFLQHAWGIATHDFIYKTDSVEWASSRIAYQVKAMLENAELSIAEATRLTGSEILNRTDKNHTNLKATIENVGRRWPPELLPKDLRRLAQTIDQLCRTLSIRHSELWEAIDNATSQGMGARSLSLSPYSSILATLLLWKGADLLTPLGHPKCRDYLFVPLEIELPPLSDDLAKRIIRPPVLGAIH